MDVTPERVATATPPDGDAAEVVVRVFACTDVGRAREHNEDALLVADLASNDQLQFEDAAADTPETRDVPATEPGLLMMVADGLGGAAAGEVASHMAVNAVLAAVRERLPEIGREAPRLATALRDAVLSANDAIHRHAQQHRELRGMGTTVTAGVLRGDCVFVAQVGDSRAYLIRDGVAHQITKDQSLMQKLVEAGEITQEQAETSARRNIILQALGPESHVKVDLTVQTLRRGDVLLFCSDGLSGQVRAEEMAAAAGSGADLDRACRQLVELANERGGPDNITAIAARFDGEGLPVAGANDRIGHLPYVFDPADDLQTPVEATPAVDMIPPSLANLAAAAADAAAQRAYEAAAARQAALAQRQAQVRPYYVILGVAAAVIALIWMYRMLTAP